MTNTAVVAGRSAPRWQVRIASTDGTVLGSGVLVSGQHVLTCAHVLQHSSARPEAVFQVDFPRSTSGTVLRAQVPQDGWLPQLTTGQRDIAVLELHDDLPADVVPARLGRGESCIGNVARVYGHPTRVVDGVWTHGTIADTSGPHGEWMQLIGDRERIEQGFSGGGVIDSPSGRVVGIIVAAYEPLDRPAAWMIPMEVVARYWLRLDTLLNDTSEDAALAEETIAGFAAMFTNFRSMVEDDRRKWVVDRLPEAVHLRLPGRTPGAEAVVRACRELHHMRVLADLVMFNEGPSPWSQRLEPLLKQHGVIAAKVSDVPDRLSADDEARLYNALLALGKFQNTSSRQDYFRLFVERHGDLPLEPTENAWADALALIRVCLPIPGALRQFLDIFPHVDRQQAGFDELRLLVESLFLERLLTDTERDELIRLLAGVPAEVLMDGYRRAAPLADLRDGSGIVRPDRIIEAVERCAQVPGKPPRIFSFVECVAARQSERAALHRWSERAAARLRLYHYELQQIRDTMASLPEIVMESALVIQLAPDALDADLFLLAATLHRGHESEQVIESRDEPETLSAVIRRIDALFDKVFRLLDFDLNRFVVEIIVPRSLLGEPVDRWSTTDAMAAPIGSRFPVVLRSYERVHSNVLRPQWRQKSRLAKRQAEPDLRAMHYVKAAGDTTVARQVRTRLMPEEKLVLVIGGPPKPQRELSPPDAYAGALSAGVAYVVWVRDSTLADRFHDAVSEVLRTTLVRELPAVVADWRMRADETDPTDLGWQTSLLACDEDRIPMQFASRELRSPTMKGQS